MRRSPQLPDVVINFVIEFCTNDHYTLARLASVSRAMGATALAQYERGVVHELCPFAGSWRAQWKCSVPSATPLAERLPHAWRCRAQEAMAVAAVCVSPRRHRLLWGQWSSGRCVHCNLAVSSSLLEIGWHLPFHRQCLNDITLPASALECARVAPITLALELATHRPVPRSTCKPMTRVELTAHLRVLFARPLGNARVVLGTLRCLVRCDHASVDQRGTLRGALRLASLASDTSSARLVKLVTREVSWSALRSREMKRRALRLRRAPRVVPSRGCGV